MLIADMQAAARTMTGLAGTFNEDMHAALDFYGATQGRQLAERMVEYTGEADASSAFTQMAARLADLKYAALAAAKRNNASLWFVPDDLSGVYQDSLGATPVTAVGQLIGSLWDSTRSLSEELLPDPGFDNPAAWTLTQPISGSVSVSGSALNLYSADGSSADANPGLVLSVGAVYRYEITIDSLTPAGQGIYIYLGGTLGSGGSVSLTAPGTYSGYITAVGTGMLISRSPGTAPNAVISRVSLKRVLGSHAVQSTTANKPTLTKLANGKYAMAFAGSHYLDTNYVPPGADATFIVVGKTGNTANQQMLFGVYKADTSTHRIYCSTSSGNALVGLGSTSGLAISPPVDAYNSSAVISMIYNSGTGYVRSIGNGIDRNLFTGFGSGLNPGFSPFIGALNNQAGGSFFNTGTVSLFCAAPMKMPDADRKAIERFGAYLAGVPYYG